MKVSRFLEQTKLLPIATRSQLTGDAPFVILSPHPDDETLGVGGLIREACIEGQGVNVIVLTDGAGSHTKSLKYPTHRLVEVRKQEVREAAKILGLSSRHVHHLDLPDAQAPAEGQVFELAVSAIIDVLRRSQAETIFVTWKHDPHCDHQAAAAMATAAARLRSNVRVLQYPIWGWHLPEANEIQESPSGYRFDISKHAEAKARAISAHRSQLTNLIDDDPTGFRFSKQTLAPFLQAYEYFYQVDSASSILCRPVQA